MVTDMSMLSAQCDELREMAGQLQEHGTFLGFGGTASTDPLMCGAAIVMREAADTIWELRNKCSNLVDERETARHNQTRNAREYARLCHENDELRELVLDWRDFAVGGADSLSDWNAIQADLEARMREMGIEVD